MLILQIPTPPPSEGYAAEFLAAACIILIGVVGVIAKLLISNHAQQLAEFRAEKAQRDLDDKAQRAEMAAKWDAADKRREDRSERILSELRASTDDLAAAIQKHDDELHGIAESQAKAIIDIAGCLKRLSTDKSK